MRTFFRNLIKSNDGGEKKVEYVELIYDLIFVYIIGRNNQLVEHVTDGFIPATTYLTYLLVTLIAIQIWYFTVTFINRYGANDVLEYVGLFINMYLLYYMGDGTRVRWEDTFYRYNLAWLLILLNLALQYFIKLKGREGVPPWEQTHILFYLRMILLEAAVVAVGIGLYPLVHVPLTPVAMLVGIGYVTFSKRRNSLMAVDFPHLAERVMLFVVFTFGEMIVGIATYFSERFDLTQGYFSLMAFLIVVGLFMTYGFFYEHILDHEYNTNGTGYMQIHIFIIFALNNITVALSLMREPEVALLPKTAFLVGSFVLYYLFLALAGRYTRRGTMRLRKGYVGYLLVVFGFVAAMALTYRNMWAGIAISVAGTFTIYGLMRRFWYRNIRPLED